MKLTDINLRLLRIYIAVVEMHGIANAQGVLNKDASTISRAIARLEEQLGLHLCERGRQGFALTSEGEQVYRQSVQLFAALRGFCQQVAGLGAPHGGQIAISMIDNIITDPGCPLPRALHTLVERYGPEVEISLHVHTPAEAERQLLEQRVDAAIGIFVPRQDYLYYQDLYEEVDRLYCASSSPLAQQIRDGADEDAIYQDLLRQDFVIREFLRSSDLSALAAEHQGEQIFSSNLEAILILILSGRYVGFLPAHYAQSMEEAGRILPVLPRRLVHRSCLQAAWPVTSSLRPLVAEFLQLLRYPHPA